MKKIFKLLFGITLITSISFIGCTSSTGENSKTPENSEIQKKIITKIDGSKTASWAFATIKLNDYVGEKVTVNLTVKMCVENKGLTAFTAKWQQNDADNSYPIIAESEADAFEANTTSSWITVTGSNTITVSESAKLIYLNGSDYTNSDFNIYLQDLTLTITKSDETSSTITVLDSDDAISEVDSSTIETSGSWLSAPSLHEAYKDYFDYVGFAVEYGNFGTNWGTPCELYYDEVQNGLAYHANTISLGNEFKPQFIFSWWGNSPSATESFTGSNGTTTTVPTTASLGGLSRAKAILKICQSKNLHMRGHVLLWHSQTDDRFFYQNYDTTGTLCSAAEMDARLEWYVKTVVKCCDDYTLSDGTPVIWAWDVANEATSDGSSSTAATSSTDSDWLRTSGSKWYEIYSAAATKGNTNYYTGTTYKSYDFVINAFRFANKYAKASTQLVYNDYGGLSGTSTSNKHQSQLRLVKLIQDAQNDSSFPTRIDAMGLQSHYSVKNSASAYQTEIQDFINLGLDVQITELDIATCDNYDADTDTVGTSGKQFDSLAAAYKAFFTMFLNNRKTDSAHGVNCVTIWGLNDESTWLNSTSQIKWNGDCIQYPLLFSLINNVDGTTKTITTADGNTTLGILDQFDEGDSYKPKPAFYSVIAAATGYSD